jgi:hypothetical protein
MILINIKLFIVNNISLLSSKNGQCLKLNKFGSVESKSSLKFFNIRFVEEVPQRRFVCQRNSDYL